MDSVLDRYGGVLLACVVALPLLVGLVAVRARGVGIRAAVAEVGAIAGTVPWLWMTLTPLPQPGAVHPVPFQEVPGYLSVPWHEAVIQVGGNLAVFAAFGAAAPMRWPLRLWTVALAAGAATVVETLQWALDLGRITSADDVLLNTAGCLLAALATKRCWRPAGPPARRPARRSCSCGAKVCPASCWNRNCHNCKIDAAGGRPVDAAGGRPT